MRPKHIMICTCILSSLLVSASASGDGALAPFLYREDFNGGELDAWASYPPNQDTAYDPYTRPGTIAPGETGICLVASEVPEWNEEQLVGAVKLLRFSFGPSSRISFRCYIKTIGPCSELRVHLAVDGGKRIVHRVHAPLTNRWLAISLTWEDIASAIPPAKGGEPFAVEALAIEAVIPDADTDMPILFGLDDVEIAALRPAAFGFDEPRAIQLDEWRERIVLLPYAPSGSLTVRGRFDTQPDRARLSIAPFTGISSTIIEKDLVPGADGVWSLDSTSLDPGRFPPGLYQGTITAEWTAGGGESETPFVFRVSSEHPAAGHPRLLYTDETVGDIRSRFTSDRFRAVRENFEREAAAFRESLDPGKLVFDTDQFPDENWIETLPAWSRDRIRASREAIFLNAFVYSLLGDREAGLFCCDVMLALADWPQWNHPWMEKRGFHTYYPLGEFAINYAIGYDLVYGLMSDGERERVRAALERNFIEPAYATYVVDDQVTSDTSNWISHIVGGLIFSVAALEGDGPSPERSGRWLIGGALKMRDYMEAAFGRDGSYGEGFRYFNFAMQSFAWTLPVFERMYGVDLSGPARYAHLETLWASNIMRNHAFTFGDSEPFLKQESTATWIANQNGPMNSWAWLLEDTRDPLLSWLYSHLKEFDTIHEVLHETSGIPARPPDTLGSVRFFRDVGTAVFKSGWGGDDFTFVFRSGPFYNHQHMDQGSFFFADHGRIFLEERYDGNHHYYDDPVYRSHAIQAISHNTILLDGDPQSQKTGDPAGFPEGMNDRAVFLGAFEAGAFAYAAGELAGVYRGKAESMVRHALFIRPRTMVLLDEIVPAADDLTAHLLFHTEWRKDIDVSEDVVTFARDGAALFLHPLSPEAPDMAVRTEPHFKVQYDTMPLIERGYLEISAHSEGNPLFFANLMTATADASSPPVSVRRTDGTAHVVIDRPQVPERVLLAVGEGGRPVAVDAWSARAALLAVAPGKGEACVVGGRSLEHGGRLVFTSDVPLTAVYNHQAKELLVADGPGTGVVRIDGGEDVTVRYYDYGGDGVR